MSPLSAPGSPEEQLPGFSKPRLVHDSQAIIENNAGRSAGWWIDPHRQLPIWEALEIGDRTVRFHLPRAYEHLGPLTVGDLQLLVMLLTRWARSEPEQRRRNHVEYSLNALHQMLGNPGRPNGERCEALRASLERLTFTTVERDWYDARRRETVREVRRYIAEADFIHSGRPGRYGSQMRGWVRFAPSLLDQLARQQYAYACDQQLLNELSSPLTRRLYLLLATDRMFGVAGNPRLRKASYTLNRAFWENIGARDANLTRLRSKLGLAGAEICAGDPIYRRIDVIEKRDRSHRSRWLLEVVRERGSSRAGEVRRARARSTSPATAELPAGVEVRVISAREQQRLAQWQADPIKHWSQEQWLANAANPDLELAWRSFRSDYREWILAGRHGRRPVAPEPLPE